jgi:hypothetical protein
MSRLERLAAAALQGLCASPRHAPHADPHMGDASGVARRAIAIAIALDAELGPEADTAGASSLTEGDVRRIIGEVFEGEAARSNVSAKGKR